MATMTSAAVRRVPRKPKGRPGRRFTGGVLGGYVLTCCYALTLVIPLYWLVISAFKERLDIVRAPFTPTFSSGFAHFAKVWQLLDMGTALANSAYITAAALAVTLVLAVPAAYALARRGRQGRDRRGTPVRAWASSSPASPRWCRPCCWPSSWSSSAPASS